MNKMFKIAGVAALALAAAACTTGIGRAASLAVSGVPPTIPQSIDSIEAEYDRLANQELADITAGRVTDGDGNVVPDAIIKQGILKAEREARRDATHQLFVALRMWAGLEKGALPTATQEEAAKMRAALLQSIMDRLNQERLVQKANRADNPPPPPPPK
jgi:hypothetical protein